MKSNHSHEYHFDLVEQIPENKEKQKKQKTNRSERKMSTKTTTKTDESTRKEGDDKVETKKEEEKEEEPKTLLEMGYKFIETTQEATTTTRRRNQKLVMAEDPTKGFKFIDQKHYDKVGDFVSTEIQNQAVQKYGLVEH